ncbi:MAG: cyclopropane-fatty-acyl-phospholipid synthase Cfa [Idiomarinaceae bacterium HL-53]|nr:MAG: cyclopropane-fatty-acyl-phospholipid synthase Cfa [Idiomarinaceae bacterium HL-53]CUS48901.1 cyclopropane-fatty-acyl-phospholipid synthase [Idiomarinaceae bacterium HL-53]
MTRMSEIESMKTLKKEATLFDNFARKLLFKVLSHIEVGHLQFKEENKIVASFGDSSAKSLAVIEVHHPRTYRRFVLHGDIGAGEAYMEGDWSSPDLTKIIQVFAANLTALDRLSKKASWLSWPFQMITHAMRSNSKSQAKQNISAHYDLGNELYTRFLDKRMQYSSAVFPSQSATIEEAQEYKLKRLCEMLELKPSDSLVEIGTGWGGLAIYAAQNYGCHVTTTTISEEQHAYVEAQIEALGLTDKITLLKQDYRDLEGTYDKLVSIEMIEAVGARYLPTFFKKCSHLLKPDGRMVLQAITIADQRLEQYNRNVDFIQRHIFPGGYLPSVELLSKMFRRHTDMTVRQLDDIGFHYADTLAAWRDRFNAHLTELEPFGYDERFSRMWNYYLSYCEGGFRERTISAVQLMATKRQCKAVLSGLSVTA